MTAPADSGSAPKVLVIGINFTPELTGIGKYTGEMTEWLDSRGYEVRVVTAPPYYPYWRVQPGFTGWRYASEHKGRVRVIRCPLWVPRAPSGIKRLLHLASFAASSLPVVFWHGLKWRPDVVLTIEPPFMCAPSAWLAARMGGARAWLHIQDLEIDAAFDLGLIKGGLLKRAVLAAERWMLRRFDRITTISRRMLERVHGKGVDPHRTDEFPNWVDTRIIRPRESSATGLRRELGIAPETCVLLYSGNMGEKQGLEVVLEVAARIGDLDAVVVMCGAGAARERLESRADGLANVRFIPLQPLERLGELLNTADVHLLPQRADAADLVMPSKLVTMMATGRPVIATAAPGTQVTAAVEGCGITVPPGDVAAFEGAVRSMVADRQLRRDSGAAARRRAVAAWDKNRVLEQAFAWIEKNSERKGIESGSVESN